MKVEREFLENEIERICRSIAKSKKIKKIEGELFDEHNITPGQTRGLINGTIPLMSVSLEILFVLAKALYKYTKDEKVNPEKYFTEYEINDMANFKIVINTPKDSEIVFENVIQTAEDQFLTTISIQRLAELYKMGRINYNPETQRNMKHIQYRGTILKQINLNMASVDAMKDAMLEGSYIPDEITLNILKTGDEKFSYNIETRTLIVDAESEIDVVDGFHRSYAILKALMINPNLDFNMELRITNWDVPKAQRFIIQKNKQNKIAEMHLKAWQQEKLENQVVKKLNESGNNEMQWKITTDWNLIQYNRAYVLFDTIAETVKYCFELKNQRDVNRVSEYLIEFFNELIGIKFDEFSNLAKTKQKSVVAHNNTFVGYIAIAAELYNKEDWKKKLEKILEKINFENNNPTWNKLGITSRVLTKKQLAEITAYFKKYCEEVK